MIVKIENLQTFGIIGIYDWEKTKKRSLVLDIDIYFDGMKAAQSDKISDTIDYDHICHQVAKEVENSKFQLLEGLADHIATRLLENPLAKKVDITIRKPGAVSIAECITIKHSKERI